MYFGQRWYNPVVGRWTTPDPLGMVDGPNLYAYLNNDPLNSIDPWGLCEGTGFGGWDLIFDLSTFSDSLKLFQISNGDIGLQVLAIAGMTAVTVDVLGIARKGAVKAVFGSGKGAEKAAIAWAKANGGKTLSMTLKGKLLSLGDKITGKFNKAGWEKASAEFARKQVERLMYFMVTALGLIVFGGKNSMF